MYQAEFRGRKEHSRSRRTSCKLETSHRRILGTLGVNGPFPDCVHLKSTFKLLTSQYSSTDEAVQCFVRKETRNTGVVCTHLFGACVCRIDESWLRLWQHTVSTDRFCTFMKIRQTLHSTARNFELQFQDLCFEFQGWAIDAPVLWKIIHHTCTAEKLVSKSKDLCDLQPCVKPCLELSKASAWC